MTTNDLRGRDAAAVASRIIVWVVLVIATLAGLATLVFGTVSLVASAIGGRVALTLASEAQLPPDADAGSARLVSGSWDTASVVVENLDTTTVVLAIVGGAIGVLTQVAIAAAIAMLCWSLLRAAPFGKSLSRTVTAAGGIVLIGGVVTTGLSTLSAWMTADQLNSPDAGLDGFWPIMAVVDPTFLAVGITLLLTGLAFEYGERLQRDTAGLV